ncbi:hypothetical protein G647_08044 [Cladophialophora carrionii CBS 160.54]|uniref:Uncharacterized protein n=1 Tax=Cladophialophora carrionii CBS 160.54 TaxID=1279043 RepID=V9D6T5_9EURO|nr:uncharacterized protein G647_08044 [Cladophialophora carrionii CBS 160.54]ETI21697.1 hypothetical protein G647_08044 [Cladophialophora carrionii CBS 160.54]
MANTAAILITARPYAELLMEAAESCRDQKVQKVAYRVARKVPSEAWTTGKPHVRKLVEEWNWTTLTDLLWVGDSYGQCLTYLRAPSTAVGMLEEVFQIRKTWKPDADETATTLAL